MARESKFLLTRIIATVGPACAQVDTLRRMIEEGASVFRINFSHGTLDGHSQSLAAIREAEKLAGRPVGVLGDLCGPKIRIGKVREGGILLEPGDLIELQQKPLVAGQSLTAAKGQPADPPPTGVIFSTNFPRIIADAQPGNRLLIDDGNVRCLVVDKTGDGDEQRLVCRVTTGDVVTSSKGLNAPDTRLQAPSITEHDWTCARWAVANGLDFLALSFVRSGSDIDELRKGLEKYTATSKRTTLPPIIAKIEKPEALRDLEAIVSRADGVMVARGDLGVEMDLAEVPLIQKRIIRMARDHGRPVIVATQMLQSMIESANPTRAEVSDVANAILDGADAVMLSGETAVGKYPLPAVHMMARVALKSQAEANTESRPPRKLQESRYRTAALAHGVAVVVRDLDAKLVVTWSELGGGARYLSQNRLGVPIISFGSDVASLRHTTLLFGVVPVQMAKPASGSEFLRAADELLMSRGWASKGDAVVVVKGDPIGTPGVTNEIHIHYVGDAAARA